MRRYPFYLLMSLLGVLTSCKSSSPDATHQVFQVKGRFLTDPCGDTIILKGVNKMSVFDEEDPYGTGYLPEIAKTKANCVRIVWQTQYSNGQPSRLSQLDTLIQRCVAQKMIPMVEMHDATCNWSELNKVILFWTRSDVVQLIQRYEHTLLVNIANEAGDDNVTTSQFTQGYQSAITQLRQAGIRTPLVIDAPACGKNLDVVVEAAAALIQSDPSHNVLFSVHPYWSKLDIQQNATPTFIHDQLQQAVTNNVPLIVGELCGFGGWPGSNDETQTCGPQGAIDYQTLLQQCQQFKIGWLAWEWGPGNGFYNYNPPVLCPSMDITTNGTYNAIMAIQANSPNAWAKEAIINSPYSIQHTSQKTNYLLNGFKCQ
jgi:mannan endo-1,4-beta-mannosidase